MKGFVAKKIFIFSLIILGLFFAVSFASAQALNPDFGTLSGLPTASLSVVVARIINAALGLLGLVAVIIVLYGGYLYMTARGEAERVQKAKKLLIQAVIGLLIIASAFAISSFILYTLSFGGGTETCIGENCPPPICTGANCLCIGPNCGCTGSGCPPTDCTNPNEGTVNSTDPWICSVTPSGKKGNIIDITGHEFGASYDSATSKVIFKNNGTGKESIGIIALCNGIPAWDNFRISVEVPMSFETAGTNGYKVYVETAGKNRSANNPLNLTQYRNDFAVVAGNPDPGIICLDPVQGGEGAAVNIIGKHFGTSASNFKLIFNNKTAIVLASPTDDWTDELIKTKVPAGAIHGDVYIADSTPAAKKLSNAKKFWVTCASTASPYSDCGSGCCRSVTSIYASPFCDLTANCGGADIGAKCSSATCVTTDPVCNVSLGLVCDSSLGCRCRTPKVGDSCSAITTSCQKDDNKCGQELYCDNTCVCQSAPQITAVTPGNGTAGNYITISGKGFGELFSSNTIFKDNFDDGKLTWGGSGNPASCLVTPKPSPCSDIPPVIISYSDQAFSGKKSLHIDTTNSNNYYFSIKRNIRSLLVPLATTETSRQYMVSFKFKGKLEAPIQIYLATVLGDSSGKATGEYFEKLVGQPIPNATYNEWQTFQGVFTYDLAMQNWVGRRGNQIEVGFLNSLSTTPTRAYNMYLDDFEVKEIKSTGLVTFCGADTNPSPDPLIINDKCGDSDDIIAKLPYQVNSICNVEDSWQNNEILVVTPVGGASGPIKVTTATGLSVQTDSAAAPTMSLSTHSYSIPDFSYNGSKRPGLCGLSPNQAVYSTVVKANGTAFGTTAGGLSGGYVYIGDINNKKQFDSPGIWTDQTISNLIVPNLKAGSVSVRVKVGSEQSNPVALKILATANQPVINSITPEQGPTGQYVTIQGSGFGSLAGTVNFWVSGVGTTASPFVWAPGAHNFPEACANTYWSDKQIIIKVPEGAKNKSAEGAAVFVPGYLRVTTAANAQSNIFNFNHCTKNNSTCPLTPGICAIEPNKAPAGTSNIVIWGDNFGSTQGSGNVSFFSNKSVANISAWTNQKIGATDTGVDIKVPELAVSGPVTVKDSAGFISNQYNFEVDDCRKNTKLCDVPNKPCCQQTGACSLLSNCISTTGTSCEYKYTFKTTSRALLLDAPKVVERHDCDSEGNQSPSPWKSPDDLTKYASKDYACVNSMIYARFSMAMNPATLTTGNIIVKECAVKAGITSVSGVGTDLECANGVALGTVSKIETVPLLGIDAFRVAPVTGTKLSADTWYQVTLSQNIQSIGGKMLDGDDVPGAGGDYIWYFKTGDSDLDCPVDTVNVTPNKAKLNLLTETQNYDGYARAANCNILNSNAFVWTWYKKYCAGSTDLIDPAVTMCTRGDAEAASAINKGGLAKISNTDPPVPGTAIVTPLDQGGVYIGAEVDNKADDTNILNIDLNIPIINDFTPKDGLINDQTNSYVTIIGSNFGVTKGSSKVSFECVPASGQTSCWVEANLANCGQAWTDTLVKVVVPKTVKDGAKIKIETSFGSDDSGDKLFNKSVNLYPFLCQLNPSYGVDGTSVTAIGDNLGDKNKTIYKTVEYGVGSFVKFQITPVTPVTPAQVEVLKNENVTKWSNTGITYKNTLTDLTVPDTKVYAAITPYAEPYNDTNNDGSYTPGEPFADLNAPADLTGYTPIYNGSVFTLPDGKIASQLDSNYLIFSQPPIITSISPNNGPVKQWVTIMGRNFGTYDSINTPSNSKVYFAYTAEGSTTVTEADLAPCEVGSWTDSYIIAVVPEGLTINNIYTVYIKTQAGIESNKDKVFTVNNKPLGAGLCALYTPSCLATKSMQACLKTTGRKGDPIGADGVRFDGSQGQNNLVFSKNLSAAITSWNENDIKSVIPQATVTGDVAVIKKMDTGERKCTGFMVTIPLVGPWCSTGIYDTIYIDVPSNALPIAINQAGTCITDEDCKAKYTDPVTNATSNRCPTSKCVNNQCAPEITSYNPNNGPVGQWVDIEGCYLGCQPGNVYFSGNPANVQMPTNGLLAGYNFDSGANNGFVGGSIASGSLKNATISDGVLKVPASGYLDLDDRLSDPATYGGENGKMTLFLKFKTDYTVFPAAAWTYLLYEVGGLNDLRVYPGNDATPLISKYVTIAMNTLGFDTGRTASFSNEVNQLTAGQWNSIVVTFESGVGLKYYTNSGIRTDTFNIPKLKMIPEYTNSKIGSVNDTFIGELDDIYVYNRLFTDKEILSLFAVKALVPSDGQGTCTNTWTCSDDLTMAYDQVTVEVPNKKLPANTNDDAITGPALLLTSDNLPVTVGNFDVGGVIATEQICKNLNCGNGAIDAGEDCDGANLNGNTCVSQDEGTGTLACKDNCKFDISDCSATKNCGNAQINGSCSKSSITDRQTCINTSKDTWDGSVCSNIQYEDEDTCIKEKYFWSGEQCDCGSCSDPTKSSQELCLAGNNIWNWNCTGKLPTCATAGLGAGTLGCGISGQKGQCKFNGCSNCNNDNVKDSGEVCDGTDLGGATCTSQNAGDGTLACSGCNFDYSDCSEPPDITPPYVESTLPGNGVENFCRNGIIDINFSELIDPATIIPANFILGSCTGGNLVRQENGIINRAFGYLKNLALKLIGYKTQALATIGVVDCSAGIQFDPKTDYTVTYSNIEDSSAVQTCHEKYLDGTGVCVASCNSDFKTDNSSGICTGGKVCCHKTDPIKKMFKTVVYLELSGANNDKIFEANKEYNVGISNEVMDKAGNQLDTAKANYASPQSIAEFPNYFIFGFKTDGTTADPDLGSGICDVDNISINVYHGSYDLDTDRDSVQNQQVDLFRCAGKDDCALPEVAESSPLITADYDQDRQTGGNQHIYKAIATSANNGFHLSVNTQWSRSDQSDPAKMLTLANSFEDTSADNNIVSNKSGVVYATINPIKDKENTGLLVVEAQARGSLQDPKFKIFKVDYLGCENPWRFEEIYGNSKTWYCRDLGDQYRCVGGVNNGKVCAKQTEAVDCPGAVCQLSLPPAGRIGPQ